MRTTITFAAAAMSVAGLALAGCSGGSAPETPSETEQSPVASADATEAPEGDNTTLMVFAAASMEPTFTELAPIFEADNPGVTVVLNFAGSQDLQEQIIEGAPADVFASANETQMTPVVEAGLNASDPIIYVTNELEIVTPPDNPAGIETFQDLGKEGLALVICAPEVPCGAATQKVVEMAGVELHPVSEEQSVTDVLAKVQAGEADAGVVYKTDAISAGDTVLGIPFSESVDAINKNPVVALSSGNEPELGQKWVDFIVSPDVQKTLENAGFGPAER